MAPEVRAFAKEHLALRRANLSEDRTSLSIEESMYLFESRVEGSVDHILKCLGD